MIPAHQNPFRVQRIHALTFRAPGFDWPQFLERIAETNYRGVIAGPHGSGKSTLLNELAKRLEEKGIPIQRIFLNESNRRIPPVRLSPETVVLLDGAEQLGWIAWQRFRTKTRHTCGLIVTMHKAARMPLIYSCNPTGEILRELLEELAPGTPESAHKKAARLLIQNKGDIRQTFLSLYDQNMS